MAMLDPNKAWSLFMTDPVDFLIVAGAVIAFFGGGAWWLRGHWTSERIAALEERLRLAQDGQTTVKKDVERLQAQVGEQPRATVQSNEDSKQVDKQIEPAKRVIIHETPDVLVGIYKNHVSIQADKLIESYVGKSIHVSGLVSDVYDSTADITVVLRLGEGLENYLLVFCRFPTLWRDRVEILRRRQTVTILGEINSVETDNIRLINCELADHPATA
jgi:hypothetical protein